MNNWPAIWSPVGLSGLSAVQFLRDSIYEVAVTELVWRMGKNYTDIHE